VICTAGDFGGAVVDDEETRTEGYFASLAEQPEMLRAADLNVALQPDHLSRLKFMNFPLQAYGMLFKWEVLVNDCIEVYRKPWQAVAEEHGLPMPDDDDVMRAVGMRPERAIMQTFLWSDDWGFTQQLAFEHFEAKNNVLSTLEFEPAEGVLQWLETLHEYQVPCCICAGTSLSKPAIEVVLSKAGLSDYFDAMVTQEDGCETAEQSYLVACIKTRRPPERCVVFDDDPRGVIAAHDAMIKAVAVTGMHSSGELRHADLRISGLDDLSLMSLRDLFRDSAPI
jgi:beta-phosphoglucomutase-like phosphatase (HAD superfamily)